MVWLPKRLWASKRTDFRPISLVHTTVKLIAKMLARCLQPKMGRLVSICQSAFIKKHNILENFVFV